MISLTISFNIFVVVFSLSGTSMSYQGWTSWTEPLFFMFSLVSYHFVFCSSFWEISLTLSSNFIFCQFFISDIIFYLQWDSFSSLSSLFLIIASYSCFMVAIFSYVYENIHSIFEDFFHLKLTMFVIFSLCFLKVSFRCLRIVICVLIFREGVYKIDKKLYKWVTPIILGWPTWVLYWKHLMSIFRCFLLDC